MNILICPSDTYAKYAGVLMTSIFENNKDLNIKVYILSTDLKRDSVENLESIAKIYDQELEILMISEQDMNIQYKENERLGLYTYIRLFAPTLVNEEKILYIDTDVICVGSLKQLDSIYMNDYFIAMSPDTAASNKHKKRLELSKDSLYGCAGVALMNLKLMREKRVQDDFIKFMQQNYEGLENADQDVLNKVCENHIYSLPIRYDIQGDFLCNVPDIDGNYANELKSELLHPILIHFTGSLKPWFSDCRHPLKKQFFKYAKMCPFKIEYKKSPTYTPYNYFKETVRYFLQYLGIIRKGYMFKPSYQIKRMVKL